MEDVVIIGGGLSGASLLYACQQNGLSVLLLENTVIGGGGATAHSRGMVRVYDPQPKLMDYASAGLMFWQDFGADHPEVYTTTGLAYFLLPGNVAKVADQITRTTNKTYEMRLVQAKEIYEKCNALNIKFVNDNRVAIWEPQAGYINPRTAARALADRAQMMGACTVEGVNVVRIIERGTSLQIETSFGKVNARRAIVATGASPHLLNDSKDIEARSISLSSFISRGNKHPNMCLIDEASGCYLRPGQSGHFYVGGASPCVGSEPAQIVVDETTAMKQNTACCKTLLGVDSYEPLSLHIGYDGYTCDYLPIIQEPSEGRVGVFCGFSGRGAKYIPSLAQSVVKTWIKKGAL